MYVVQRQTSAPASKMTAVAIQVVATESMEAGRFEVCVQRAFHTRMSNDLEGASRAFGLTAGTSCVQHHRLQSDSSVASHFAVQSSPTLGQVNRKYRSVKL